jgi:hypothetical protein
MTPLGVLHTAISLVALMAGLISLLLHKEISPRTPSGLVYLSSTVFTCITGLSVFHSGVGVPHVFGVVTLLVLALAKLAEEARILGRMSAYVPTVGYSLSLFIQMIHGVSETFTRLPVGAPLYASPADPNLIAPVGVLLIGSIVVSALQVRRLMALNRRKCVYLPTRG